MATLNLKIVTPDKLFFDDRVDSIIVKGVEGDLAVLKGRTPIATALAIGKVRIFQDSKEKIASITEGYMISKDNNISIVTDSAEWFNQTDVIRMENSKL